MMTRYRNLDAWITGNHGLDHPDNIERVLPCRNCQLRFNVEEMIDVHSDLDIWLCDDCHTKGFRVCDSCSDAHPIDEMLSDSPPSQSAEFCARERAQYGYTLNLERYCDNCIDTMLQDCPQLRSWRDSLYRLETVESMLSARGKPLPVRIELWCSANEPADKASAIAARLVATFADRSFDDFTGYERKVFRAVNTGGWRK